MLKDKQKTGTEKKAPLSYPQWAHGSAQHASPHAKGVVPASLCCRIDLVVWNSSGLCFGIRKSIIPWCNAGELHKFRLEGHERRMGHEEGNGRACTL